MYTSQGVRPAEEGRRSRRPRWGWVGVGDEERRGFLSQRRRRRAGARVSEEQETGVRLSGDERITEKLRASETCTVLVYHARRLSRGRIINCINDGFYK